MTTAAVQNVRLVLAAANARGVPPGKLLAAAGLEPQQLIDADGRIPAEIALRAWQAAAELSGDPAFGLSVVEHLRPDFLGGLGYAVHGSATLGDGLRRLARFFRVVNQHASLEVIEDGARARLRMDVEHDVHPDELRHPIECLMSALLLVARRTTGAPIGPLAVAFRHAAPADAAAHLRVFGVPPAFGQPASVLALPREALALPHLTPDPALTAVAERHLRRMQGELPAGATLAGRVRRVLLEELRLGEPTRVLVAGKGFIRCTSCVLTPGTWTHVAAVLDRGVWSIYQDGVAGTLTGTTTLAPVAPAGAFSVGSSPSGGESFRGAIDEVRAWAVARTAQELGRDRTVSRGGSEAGLVAYYRLDEGTGDWARDATPSGRDLELAGPPAWIASGAPLATTAP